MLQRILLPVVFIFLNWNPLLAQVDSAAAAALDDGNLSKPKIVLKLHPFQAAVGDIPITAEVNFLKRFGLEAGVGFIVPVELPYILQEITGHWVQNVKAGYSLRVQPKFYHSSRRAPEGLYWHFIYRKRHFATEVASDWDYEVWNDAQFMVGSGYQWYTRKRITIDMWTAAGIRVVSAWKPGDLLPDAAADWMGSVNLGIGYRF